MSLLNRLLGRRTGDPYSEGIALFEQGRFADAAELLRVASRDTREGSSSLATFYLRQCLVNEGRRLLSQDDAAGAEKWFGEAAATWDRFPDLAVQHAVALALAERWEDALAETGRALDLNPEYVQASLVRACALAATGDDEAAGAVIGDLREKPKSAGNPLVRNLEIDADGGFDWRAVLSSLSSETVARGDREAVAGIVEMCRQGRWEEGVQKLRALCEESPTYPDYRVKLAAALFQTGRTTQALAEVDRALELNPRYRTAAHLKALILADQRRYAAAREVILSHPALSELAGGHPSEELFCSYLRGVLALVTGHFEEADKALAAWGDLVVSFPMAELMRAAVEDLSGRPGLAGQRLQALAKHWPGDGDYTFLYACHQLRQMQLDDLEKVLGRWSVDNETDTERRDLLRDHLRLAKQESLPAPEESDEADLTPDRLLLAARSAALTEDWSACLRHVRRLAAGGYTSEKLASLTLRAYLATGEASDEDRPEVVPDTAVAEKLCRLHADEESGEAQVVLQRFRELHPVDPRWIWLDPATWLRPIRRWIG